MQYTQRKLQRSVTEMRRYSMLRPNWSRSVVGDGRWAWACRRVVMCHHRPPRRVTLTSSPDAYRGRVHPLARPVDVVLALPDRHALLELLDHVAARVVRGAAMRMRDGDRDARLAELERTEPMLDRRCRSCRTASAASRAIVASSRSAMATYAVYSMPVTARPSFTSRTVPRKSDASRRCDCRRLRAINAADVDRCDRRCAVRTSAAGDRWNDRDFVAGREHAVTLRVRSIHRDERLGGSRAGTGSSRTRVDDVAHGRAVRQLER